MWSPALQGRFFAYCMFDISSSLRNDIIRVYANVTKYIAHVIFVCVFQETH